MQQSILFAITVYITLFHPVVSSTVGQATATIPFPPLFRKPPTAFYIFEALTSEDVIIRDHVPPNRGTPLPRVESKYYVTYRQADANLDGRSRMYSDLALTFAGGSDNVLPNPSGAFNGCEGSLTLQCSIAVVDALKISLSKVESLLFAGQRLKIDYKQVTTNTTIKSLCPENIFNEFYMDPEVEERGGSESNVSFLCRTTKTLQSYVPDIPFLEDLTVLTTFLLLNSAVATEHGDHGLLYPSRNFSMSMVIFENSGATASDELNKILVTIMTRAPSDNQVRKDISKIQVEIMCMRPTEGLPTYTPTLDDTRPIPTRTGSGVSNPTSTSSASRLITEASLFTILGLVFVVVFV